MGAAVNRRHVLRTISWRWAWALNRVDSIHIVAVGLLALWASLILTIDYPLLRETQQMSLQLASIPEPAYGPTTASKSEPRNSVDAFYAALPEFDTYPDQLRALNALAEKSGVVIERVDFQYEPLTKLPIKKLAMRMFITGTAAQQRRFLPALLNAFPNLSIARLAYSKSTDGSMKIDQKLDVHLYYRSKAAA